MLKTKHLLLISHFSHWSHAVIIKTAWYWHKNRHTDQWNRVESQIWTLNSMVKYLTKQEKNIQWKKDSLFNKWCWENWTTMYRRMKLDHSLTPFTKVNSKWIKDLNMRQESIKILENIGSNLFDISHSNFFQDMSPRQRKQKQKWIFGTSSRSKASAQQR